MIVVLPAPFGPSSAKTSPSFTSKATFLTAFGPLVGLSELLDGDSGHTTSFSSLSSCSVRTLRAEERQTLSGDATADRPSTDWAHTTFRVLNRPRGTLGRRLGRSKATRQVGARESPTPTWPASLWAPLRTQRPASRGSPGWASISGRHRSPPLTAFCSQSGERLQSKNSVTRVLPVSNGSSRHPHW